MTHGSLFAGIGGFDLGFKRAGFKTLWQVEIEPFCRAVLKTRFPKAGRFGDIRQCGAHNLGRVDIITAGVPCQDVSVAGKRAGLAGKRTRLFYHFARILCELRPAWFVFENVPGLFSSNQGRDFAEVLRVFMVRCGYGVAWRVLDSRFFGVAQRRHRVFIVGSLAKPCPPEVLFEPPRRARNPAAGRKAAQDVAYSLAAGSGGSKFGSGRDRQDTFVAGAISPGTHPSGFNGQDAYSGNIVAAPITAGLGAMRNDQDRYPEHLVCGTLGSKSPKGGFRTTDLDGHGAYVSSPPDSHRVRGFAGLPEGLDSARYRALGNAVTVQVAEWIGKRILNYEC